MGPVGQISEDLKTPRLMDEKALKRANRLAGAPRFVVGVLPTLRCRQFGRGNNEMGWVFA